MVTAARNAAGAPYLVSSRRVRGSMSRYQPETDSEPHFQSYTVPFRDEWVVLDALNHIKDHLDATLSYRWSCHMAICGSCAFHTRAKDASSLRSR